jgi:hypothetical protein
MKNIPIAAGRLSRFFLIVAFSLTVQSCYHYRLLNTNSDPTTEYQKKVMWSYCWGLVNKPQAYVVPNCDKTAIDEVRVTTTFGNTLLTLITLGIVCPVSVEWKCHKPCQKVGDI